MDTVLAIDQSTSATKALILDLRAGRVLAHASGEHRQLYPPLVHPHHARIRGSLDLASATPLLAGEGWDLIGVDFGSFAVE
jgi:hypothetical protein